MANATLHTEFSQVGQVDEHAGIIRGVSVIATGEAIGHGLFADATSLENVVNAAKSHTGGVIAKGNHGSGIFEVIGTLKNFRVDGDRVRADFYLLKTHPRFASIVELARMKPASKAGFSISFSYAPEVKDEKVFIRVKTLWSVDLVDSPALNPTGMFNAKHTLPVTPLDRVASAFRAQIAKTKTKPAATLPNNLKGLERTAAAFKAQTKTAAL